MISFHDSAVTLEVTTTTIFTNMGRVGFDSPITPQPRNALTTVCFRDFFVYHSCKYTSRDLVHTLSFATLQVGLCNCGYRSFL